jgi:hypothetical protein
MVVAYLVAERGTERHRVVLSAQLALRRNPRATSGGPPG